MGKKNCIQSHFFLCKPMVSSTLDSFTQFLNYIISDSFWKWDLHQEAEMSKAHTSSVCSKQCNSQSSLPRGEPHNPVTKMWHALCVGLQRPLSDLGKEKFQQVSNTWCIPDNKWLTLRPALQFPPPSTTRVLLNIITEDSSSPNILLPF